MSQILYARHSGIGFPFENVSSSSGATTIYNDSIVELGWKNLR